MTYKIIGKLNGVQTSRIIVSSSHKNALEQFETETGGTAIVSVKL